MTKEITVTDLKALVDAKEKIQLIDVREPHELEIATIGGINIPQNDIPQSIDKIDKDKQVIVYCRSGVRSANAIKFIQSKTGQENLYNLKGGIKAIFMPSVNLQRDNYLQIFQVVK